MRWIKKIRFIIIMVLIVVFITACNNSDIDQEEYEALREENQSLKNEVRQLDNLLEKILDELDEHIAYSETITASLNRSNIMGEGLIQVIKTLKDPDLQEIQDIFTIYSANVDTYETEPIYWVVVKKDIGIEAKIEVLLATLRGFFSNLPITLLEIKEMDGQAIAVINLEESEVNQSRGEAINFEGASWATHYFQGSAGGTVTSTRLVHTLLQSAYEGEWIDGVQFLYNGKTIEFDHVYGLSEIQYR